MDNKFLDSVLPLLKVAIIALGIVFVLLILFGSESSNESVASFGLVLTYIVTAVSAIAAIGFGVGIFLKNAKHDKKGIIGLVAFVAIMLLSYAVASSDVPNIKQQIDGATAKMVSGGLIAVYVFLFGAVASIALSEVKKMLK